MPKCAYDKASGRELPAGRAPQHGCSLCQCCQRTDGRGSRYTDSLPHVVHCLAPTGAADSIKELIKVLVQILISLAGQKPTEERAVFASFN